MSQKDETNLWHHRLGHINIRDLARLNRRGIVKDLSRLTQVNNPMCNDCQKGKINLV